MRIAFIGHKRIPSREGGIEIVVDELATRMVARGEQVVVYNRKGHNVAGEEFDNLFLVKSVFRVSSLIFFGFRHEECRPVVCFTGCPSCRT